MKGASRGVIREGPLEDLNVSSGNNSYDRNATSRHGLPGPYALNESPPAAGPP